VFTAVMS